VKKIRNIFHDNLLKAETKHIYKTFEGLTGRRKISKMLAFLAIFVSV